MRISDWSSDVCSSDLPFAVKWFLKSNGRRSTSLYRQVVTNGGATSDTPAEIAEGVTDMQVTYKVGPAPSYVPAASGLAWNPVAAVHAQLAFEAVRGARTQNDTAGTGNQVPNLSVPDYILPRKPQDIP